MFEFITSIAASVAVDAAYRVATVMNELRNLKMLRDSAKIVAEKKGAMLRSTRTGNDAEVSRVVARIIEQIESKENKPIEKITPSVVSKYTRVLSDTAMERALRDVDVSRRRGKRLLAEVRRERIKA